MQKHNDESMIYDSTVDSDQAASMQKAIELFMQQQAEQKQPVQRPDFSPVSGLCWLAVALILSFACFIASEFLRFSVIYCLIFVALMIVCHAKKAVIWLILLYQRYAPERLRASCVFTPTCSEYMRLSVLKYGLLRGVVKGIKRLLRCHPPNGGEDNP